MLVQHCSNWAAVLALAVDGILLWVMKLIKSRKCCRASNKSFNSECASAGAPQKSGPEVTASYLCHVTWLFSFACPIMHTHPAISVGCTNSSDFTSGCKTGTMLLHRLLDFHQLNGLRDWKALEAILADCQ